MAFPAGKYKGRRQISREMEQDLFSPEGAPVFIRAGSPLRSATDHPPQHACLGYTAGCVPALYFWSNAVAGIAK
jgi:hypothetical protein